MSSSRLCAGAEPVTPAKECNAGQLLLARDHVACCRALKGWIANIAGLAAS
jgi:hypothetical protein